MWWKKSMIFLLVAAILSTHLSDAAVTVQVNHDFVSTGKKLTNRCTVSGGDTFDGWYKPGGEKITATSGNVYVETESATDHKLVLANVQDAIAGTYKCRAASGTEEEYRVIVEFTFDQSVVENQDIYLNENSVISCAVISGNPFPTFTWYKGDNRDQQINLNLARYQRLDSGSLQINSVVQSDAGNYRCVVVQVAGTRQRESTKDFVVSVVERPSFSETPISKSATAGYSVSFNCRASGSPTPTIKWFQYSELNTGGRYTIADDGTLTITGVVSSDVGEYRCEASNRGGKVQASASILAVYEVPTIPPITDQVVDVGDNTQIVCIAQGNPTPIPQWTRPGFTLNQERAAGSSRLTLTNIQLADAGVYTCEATNSAVDNQGNPVVAKREVNLQVQSSPQIVAAKTTTQIYSWIGTTTPITLVCYSTGYPYPTFEIRRNNQKVTGTEATNQGEYTLEILVDEEDEFGAYECVATNTFGSDTQAINILKASTPGTPNTVQYDASCKAITVSWQEPTNDGGVPVTNYKVVLLKDGAQVAGQMVEAVQTFHTFEGLDRQAEYTITVKALNNVGYGDEVEGTQETKYECPPSAPVINAPVGEVLTSNSITLEWSASKADGNDNEITYDVMYAVYNLDGSNGEWTTVKAGSSLSEKVTGLAYDTTFSFRVVAKNSGGDTLSNKRQYSTPEEGSSKGTDNTPGTAARTAGLDGGAVAGIIIAIILIILIVVDLFCCFFNKCGFMYCCCQTFFNKESKQSKYAADDKKGAKEGVPLKEPAAEKV